MSKERPIIGITMGDPASIGPELSVRALAEEEVYQECKPLIVGDISMLEKALNITGLDGYSLNSVSSPAEGKKTPCLRGMVGIK